MSVGMIALSLAIGLGVVVGIRSIASSRRKADEWFKNREFLSADDIFAKYYSSTNLTREHVTHLWTEFTAKLNVPPGKLRPDDRFDTQLSVSGFLASLDDPRDELAQFAMKTAAQSSIDLDLRAIETVDDLIRALAPPIAK